jgi:hypothetical protein
LTHSPMREQGWVQQRLQRWVQDRNAAAWTVERIQKDEQSQLAWKTIEPLIHCWQQADPVAVAFAT